jgi:hypothetical protein
MIPLTVVGEVTCADAPVTSHPVVPIAIVPTISDVFLKNRRFGSLNLSTLPPAIGSRSPQYVVERLGGRDTIRGAPAEISTLVSGQKSKSNIPHLSYTIGRIWSAADLFSAKMTLTALVAEVETNWQRAGGLPTTGRPRGGPSLVPCVRGPWFRSVMTAPHRPPSNESDRAQSGS